MRPVSLQVKGFTAFRDEQNVSFTDLDLFAVSGPTGAGKSSLLDAITYALYGEIERVGNQCALLITHGQPRMTVKLVFALGGEVYRLTRSTPRKGITKATLERSPDGRDIGDQGEWLPLADKVGEVTTRIEALLGIDYLGFTRTVLLPQGKFDQFLAGDRSERRTILTELLDLRIYDDMQKRANQIAKEARLRAQTTIELLERDFAGVSEEALEAMREAERLARDRERALTAAAARVAKLVERRDEARRAAQDLRTCSTELRDRSRTAATAAGRLERVAKDAAGADKELRERQRSAKEAVAAVRKAREALEEARHANAVAFVATGLKKGDPCPVCGEPLSKAPRHRSVDLEGLEKRLEGSEEAVAGREGDRERAAEVIRRVATSIATERGSLSALAGAATIRRARELAGDAELPKLGLKLPAGEDASALATFARGLGEWLGEVAAELEQISKRRAGGDEALLAEATKLVGGLLPAAASLDAIVASLASALRLATSEGARAEERAKTIAARLERKAELEAEIETTMHRSEVMHSLSLDLQQNAIVEYLQGEELRALANDGSGHLAYLSHDRYRLRYHDDEFWVRDTWNNDEERSVRTLSGGETFLASLALALALSQHVRELSGAHRPRLDSLFIDEGFGTLDSESLDTVVGAIDRLGGDGRLVGVITHVRDLAERFVRIEVEKSQRGSQLKLVA